MRENGVFLPGSYIIHTCLSRAPSTGCTLSHDMCLGVLINKDISNSSVKFEEINYDPAECSIRVVLHIVLLSTCIAFCFKPLTMTTGSFFILRTKVKFSVTVQYLPKVHIRLLCT